MKNNFLFLGLGRSLFLAGCSNKSLFQNNNISKSVDVNKFMICTPNETWFFDGVKETKIKNNGTYFKISNQTKIYQRCDKKGCDAYGIQILDNRINSGGIYLYSDEKKIDFKIFPINGEASFIDIATLGNTSITSAGKCKNQ